MKLEGEVPIGGLEKMIELSGTDGSRELLLRSMGTGSSMHHTDR